MTDARKGILALVLLAFLYSCMGLFVRFLDTDLAVFQQTYLRILGAVLMGAILFWPKLNFRKLAHVTKRDWWVVFLRAATFAIGVVFFTYAFTSHDTSYSNATFITVFPLLPVLGYLFLRERLSVPTVAWVLLGFVGVGFVAVSDPSQVLSWGRGEIFAVISAIGFDMSYIARKWQSDYLNEQESVVLIFLIEGLLVLGASFFVVEPPLTQASFGFMTLVVIVVSSLFNVGNLYLTGYGFRRVPATVGGNILTLETLFALIFSIFLFAEIPTAHELFGGALIVLSVYQVNKRTAK
jgi:drug/metabolite transporter (DMT)-like permease